MRIGEQKMSTVGYISRDMTGTTFQGIFPEGSPAHLDVSRAKDISLNLERAEIESYAKRGADLHIVLANGETLVLENYYAFSTTGAKNLFLSANGDFIEVVLEDKADGMLFASYEPLDLTGKWSAYDDLAFLDVERIEPVVAPLAAPLFGGFGAAGAAAAGLVGTAVVLNDDENGGSSSTPDTTAPVADVTSGTQSTGDIVNAADHSAGPVITGTGEPGASLDVLVNGVTQSTTVDANGTWSVTFDPADIPTGEYDTQIVITTTDAAGNSRSYNDILEVDTIAPPIALDTVEGDDIVNLVEAADGVQLSGTGEAGASITVQFQGHTRSTTVANDGTWSINYSAGQITGGSYDSTIAITSTDAAGNTSSHNHTVRIDTETTVSVDTGQVGGDDTVNAAERSGGIDLTGTVEPGSAVLVQLGSVTKTASVDASGNWTANFAASDIPTGSYDAAVTVQATDAVGNTASTSHTLTIDTQVTPLSVATSQTADDVVNLAERKAGVTLTGTVEQGSGVEVSIGSVTRSASVDSSGNWSVTFAEADIPSGEYVTNATITATDAAGNTRSISETFTVDTEYTTPDVDSVTFSSGDVRRISAEGVTDSYSVSALETGGAVSSPAAAVAQDPVFGTEFTFSTPVPDGTHLVVTSEDTAGNASSTLVVLEDNAVNGGTMDHAGLSQFNVDALNLDYASDVSLNLTEANIKALSGNSDTLTVHGGADDTLTVTGAAAAGTQLVDGQIYNVYTIGTDGTTLLVDQDVNVLI